MCFLYPNSTYIASRIPALFTVFPISPLYLHSFPYSCSIFSASYIPTLFTELPVSMIYLQSFLYPCSIYSVSYIPTLFYLVLPTSPLYLQSFLYPCSIYSASRIPALQCFLHPHSIYRASHIPALFTVFPTSPLYLQSFPYPCSITVLPTSCSIYSASHAPPVSCYSVYGTSICCPVYSWSWVCEAWCGVPTVGVVDDYLPGHEAVLRGGPELEPLHLRPVTFPEELWVHCRGVAPTPAREPVLAANRWMRWNIYKVYCKYK